MQPWRRKNLLHDLTEMGRGANVTSIVLYHYRDQHTAPRQFFLTTPASNRRRVTSFLRINSLIR
jgi:hypothetical protein